jgi:gamma-glutamylcyclotransferase (GGCT)/AIG2-like uncharacterized protein YtfP
MVELAVNAMNVFTYGSLMFPGVWARVVRGTYRSTDATVHGFRRVRVRGRQHPALIISANNAPMVGRLYYDVSAEDVARLDHFETHNYARVAIAVTVDERVVSAQSYLALNVDSLLNEDWSVAEFEQRGLPIFNATYVVENAPPE